jgi:hypothetical protein
MRKHLLVIVNASGRVDLRMMGQRFGQLIGVKAAKYNTQAKKKKPQAFARCGNRAQNCSVLKRRCSPGAFKSDRSVRRCGVGNAVP